MTPHPVPLDYLVIGHVCVDRTSAGLRVGGSAAYAGRTAETLGCRTAVVTSAAADFDLSKALPEIAVHPIPAPETTTFENRYTDTGRQQTIHCRARRLTPEDIPEIWRSAPIVHIGPIADEVDPDAVFRFKKSLVGLTPQGWMRGWDEHGRVTSRDWSGARKYFAHAAAVILSAEDLPAPETAARYRQWARLLVLTKGSGGCTLFFDSKVLEVPTAPVRETDPTGAGDIFAAAFLIRFHRNGGDPMDAARFANRIAGLTVTEAGIDRKMNRLRHFLNGAADG